MKKIMTLTLALVCAVFLPISGIAQSAGDYVIGPQDVLTIQVFDQADLGGKYAVETDGTFSFPLIGRITAAGLTLREERRAKAVIRTAAADGVNAQSPGDNGPIVRSSLNVGPLGS